MDKQKLLDRLSLLQDEKKMLMSTYDGAISDVNYWLQQLETAAEANPQENAVVQDNTSSAG